MFVVKKMLVANNICSVEGDDESIEIFVEPITENRLNLKISLALKHTFIYLRLSLTNI